MNKASLTKSPQISLIRDIDIVTILVFLSQGSHNIGVENGVASLQSHGVSLTLRVCSKF